MLATADFVAENPSAWFCGGGAAYTKYAAGEVAQLATQCPFVTCPWSAVAVGPRVRATTAMTASAALRSMCRRVAHVRDLLKTGNPAVMSPSSTIVSSLRNPDHVAG